MVPTAPSNDAKQRCSASKTVAEMPRTPDTVASRCVSSLARQRRRASRCELLQLASWRGLAALGTLSATRKHRTGRLDEHKVRVHDDVRGRGGCDRQESLVRLERWRTLLSPLTILAHTALSKQDTAVPISGGPQATRIAVDTCWTTHAHAESGAKGDVTFAKCHVEWGIVCRPLVT